MTLPYFWLDPSRKSGMGFYLHFRMPCYNILKNMALYLLCKGYQTITI